jgi:hypothetical protein
MLKKFLLFVAASILSIPSIAAGITGNNLIDWGDAYDRVAAGKSSQIDTAQAASLKGYVIAVADEASFHRDICIEQGVTFDQLVRAVLKSLRSSPEVSNLDGYVLVKGALVETFACKK